MIFFDFIDCWSVILWWKAKMMRTPNFQKQWRKRTKIWECVSSGSCTWTRILQYLQYCCYCIGRRRCSSPSPDSSAHNQWHGIKLEHISLNQWQKQHKTRREHIEAAPECSELSLSTSHQSGNSSWSHCSKVGNRQHQTTRAACIVFYSIISRNKALALTSELCDR